MDINSYYKKKLYPLQDKVLKILDKLKSPFYLTGGTALSRCYFNHRYSDDLDLFLNDNPKFRANSEKTIKELKKIFKVQIITKADKYYSLQIDKKLKIDLINDVASYIGKTKKTPIYSKVDNLVNIFSNKISALISRDEPKDVVDIWIIFKNQKIDWEQIFIDTSSKAIGIFPPTVAQKLDTFPIDLIDKINWVKNDKPTKNLFKIDIQKLILDILKI
ncbi:nucleotidyl transferase AbiEii/AbiGii toxin family protein [Patescibacteria group bacterium]|nr:nucleotidyl transferase AbiEii/AbiGii toxin family protein [Patescibacteria group bacterium]